MQAAATVFNVCSWEQTQAVGLLWRVGLFLCSFIFLWIQMGMVYAYDFITHGFVRIHRHNKESSFPCLLIILTSQILKMQSAESLNVLVQLLKDNLPFVRDWSKCEQHPIY